MIHFPIREKVKRPNLNSFLRGFRELHYCNLIAEVILVCIAFKKCRLSASDVFMSSRFATPLITISFLSEVGVDQLAWPL